MKFILDTPASFHEWSLAPCVYFQPTQLHAPWR